MILTFFVIHNVIHFIYVMMYMYNARSFSDLISQSGGRTTTKRHADRY